MDTNPTVSDVKNEVITTVANSIDTVVTSVSNSLVTGQPVVKGGLDVNSLKDQLASISKQFVKDNLSIGIGLSEDVIKAILFNAVVQKFPVPTLTPSATPEQVADAEQLATAATANFQLVMAAQAQYSDSVAAVQSSALKVVETILPVIAAALLKPLVGL